MTVLPENLSVHANTAHGNRSRHATMMWHDVTTAYAAEMPAKASRVVANVATKNQQVVHKSLERQESCQSDKIPDNQQIGRRNFVGDIVQRHLVIHRLFAMNVARRAT
jgi:hypothetical protein